MERANRPVKGRICDRARNDASRVVAQVGDKARLTMEATASIWSAAPRVASELAIAARRLCGTPRQAIALLPISPVSIAALRVRDRYDADSGVLDSVDDAEGKALQYAAPRVAPNHRPGAGGNRNQRHRSANLAHEAARRRRAAQAIPFVSGPEVLLGLNEESNGGECGGHAGAATLANPSQPCAMRQSSPGPHPVRRDDGQFRSPTTPPRADRRGRQGCL